MEALQHYRAMEAFCRQHAKIEGEDPKFWLTEAELWARYARSARSTTAVRSDTKRVS